MCAFKVVAAHFALVRLRKVYSSDGRRGAVPKSYVTDTVRAEEAEAIDPNALPAAEPAHEISSSAQVFS